MAVYWRVKRWKATIVVAPGPKYGGGPLGTFIQYGYWNAGSEEELCCHNATYFQNDPPEFGGDNYPWASSAFGFAFLGQKPYLAFSYLPIDEGHWQHQTNVYHESYDQGELIIENFSPAIRIPAYSSPTPGDGWGATVSVTIRADEYWSYGGTYDTQTGQLLN